MEVDKAKLNLLKVENYKSVPFVNLQQLYEFEFSPITGYELNKLGLYEQEEIKKSWCKQGIDVYVLYYSNQPIGFTVVNLGGMIDGQPGVRDIAEFFVMPAFRNNHIGEWMAHQIFSLYEYRWEVRQLPGLVGVRKFWNKVIDHYTQGDYEELELSDDRWEGSVQRFSGKR